MKARYVVDTNVLIAASAGDPIRPAKIDATPDDPLLRMQVWSWLDKFDSEGSRLVLDGVGKIHSEYRNKLGFNDYGIQVIIRKFDTSAVDFVAVDYDTNGDGVLSVALTEVVHDGADRKMVAAAVRSHVDFGEGCVAFAGDTDWHDWEEALANNGVLLEPIIETWSRKKHAEKKAR